LKNIDLIGHIDRVGVSIYEKAGRSGRL